MDLDPLTPVLGAQLVCHLLPGVLKLRIAWSTRQLESRYLNPRFALAVSTDDSK